MTYVFPKKGHIEIRLSALMNDRALSKNKLCQLAQMQRSQLNHYYNNTISRLDVDVLERLCTVLDCELDDLLTFVS